LAVLIIAVVADNSLANGIHVLHVLYATPFLVISRADRQIVKE
jgi:hypothetical protein